MRKKILSLMAIALIAISCNKNDDLTVTLKLSGTLSVKLTDDSGTVIPDTKVKLYDGSYGGSYLEAVKTDKNGSVDFGELNSGSYSVVVDTPKINGIKYLPVKDIQVISGSKKQVTINVQEYCGTVNLRFYKDNTSPATSFSGLNVILVPSSVYYSQSTLAYVITKAEFSGKTDTQGKISFKIPSDRDFRLIVYLDSKTVSSFLENLDVNKDEVSAGNYYLDPVTLY